MTTASAASGRQPDTRTLQEFRAAMPVLDERIHLFAGAMAPLADPVRRAMAAWLDVWGSDPMEAFNSHVAHGQRLREVFADLIGATSDEIAVLANTSEGANRIIGMLATEPRDVVLVDETTFPTSIYPWLTKTTKRIEYVPREQLSDPDWLAERLGRRDVLAVSVSHVGNTNGFRHDLADLGRHTKATGTLLLVDAAQSAGVLPIDVGAMGVDVLTTTTLKWLMGPPGIGLLYVSRPLMQRLPLRDVGYLLAQFEGPWPRTEVPGYPPVAASVEVGIAAIPSLPGAVAGIELLRSVGIDTIAAQVETLMASLLPALRERGLTINTPDDPARRGGVVSALHPKAPQLQTFLAERNIEIGGFEGGTVRIDPHAYNTLDEIGSLLAAIDEFNAGGGQDRGHGDHTSAAQASARTSP